MSKPRPQMINAPENSVATLMPDFLSPTDPYRVIAEEIAPKHLIGGVYTPRLDAGLNAVLDGARAILHPRHSRRSVVAVD